MTLPEKIDKLNNEKYKTFLELYPKTRMISKTADAMGIDRRTVHHWLNKDSEFNDAFLLLKKELEIDLLERHLSDIEDIAFDTKTPPQTRALVHMFKIKKLDPSYRDKVMPDINISGDIIFKSSMPGMIVEGEVIDAPKQIEEQGENETI